ncbi:basic helix-loop-helix neural transcription factor TAP [Anopheles nili]|uniref:basic helix-loop-helix neural transcription factor TAP n=1 Tax=Anopheles nili TaxID=185578 RepID=UPI00237C1E37|nr:basic helix-loop-helix neural transcription factor TAP [Anopheles nili]
MPKRKKAPSPKFDLLEDGFDDDLSSNDDKPGTPIQRNAANARERARMRVLSKAFFNLKRNIPWVPADTKLSKLDTLRLAKNYITYLAATLDGQSVEDFSTNLAQPPKTAWPFIFQQVQPHETNKTKQHQQQPTAHSTTFSATPPNVGQSTCATEQQKWLGYHQKEAISGRAPTGGGSENIKSQSVAPPSNTLLGFPENHATSAGSMEGVSEFGGFGDAMGALVGSGTTHGGHQHHHNLPQEPHHRQQHSLMQQDQHQLHQQPHHYATTGGGMPVVLNDGCHMGGAVGMSGAYHRQHMAPIGSD